MSKSFFVNYEFSDRVSGFMCSCHGENLYSPEYYESVDRMLDDVMKLLKKRDAQVTFSLFTGFESIDLLRLLRTFDGKIDMVTWKRNNYGYTVETFTERENKLTLKTVKAYVFRALEMFNAYEVVE